ncbi:MAG: 4-vinyl reductase [Oscillospiraceae bacterium]|jgi:predicted hydrocarbon binding protein|nr:4-vinyl reductase [Oscillospiraceae bacterium]
MSNIFAKNAKPHNQFSWENLGDIREGRGDLGEDMPVLVYRLMQYTMLDILTREYGVEAADRHFRDSGYLAGTEFAKNNLRLDGDFGEFLENLQTTLKSMKIGILRMEEFDAATGNIVLTVGQDLDCSGLPVTNETVCTYDEGFIAGILEAFTGEKYDVREVDCWANGDRVCRFNGTARKK